MIITPNQQYNNAAQGLQAVRDCIAGEPTIKRKKTTYLKNPDSVDQTSDQSTKRYEKYIENAEFDGFPNNTEIEMIGRMKAGDAEIELPEGLEYLEYNSDGNGLPMTGMVEVLYKNLLEAKYHILLSEMGSLPSADTESLSVADVEALDLKATIKMYTRESMIDWDFTRINGALQFSFMILREYEMKREQNLLQASDLGQTEIITYLLLALDEDGYYFQQKYIEGSDKAVQTYGNPVYPEVNGERLKFIPVQLVADEELQAGIVPESLGYLSPICSTALSRYQVSADYKEALRFMQPTTFTKGWKASDKDLFKTLNGREYMAFGVGQVNNLPNSVEVSIEGLGIQSEPYEKYMVSNEKKARALGASFETEPMENTSATEASISDAKATAAQASIVASVDSGLTKAIAWCGMFMGLWSVEELERAQEDISLNLYDDFGEIKITPEEVRATIEAVNSALMTREEGTRKLVQGGFTVSDADEILDGLEEFGSAPAKPANNSDDESQV